MPDYLVTDPATGQRIKMTGPAPPSEALIRLALAKVQPLPSHDQLLTQKQGPEQPTNAFGQTLPLSPEQDYPGKAIQSILGFLGLGNDDAKSNRFGQLLAAGMPIAGALKKIGVGEEAARDAILAWHASPHDFEQFDMGKVGTGQGAQSYGHGLYQAENPALSGLGGSYDREFTAQNLGKHDLNQAEDRVLQMIRKGHSPMEVLVDLGKSGLSFDEAQAVYDRVDKAKAKIYRTAIKADPDQFLDWDKPLSQQSEFVKKAPAIQRLLKEEEAYKARYPGGGLGERTGANVLTTVKESELHKAGIPGIKYLDQGSRAISGGELISVEQTPQGWQSKIRMNRPNGEQYFTTSTPHPTKAAAEAWAQDKIATKGTHNYVVFDDKLIDILKKYAVAGAAGGSLASLGQPPAEEQK